MHAAEHTDPKLKGRDLITLQEWSRDEIEETLGLAEEIKRLYKSGGIHSFNPLLKRTLIMLFYAPSTRTRSAFETAMTMLGGHAQHVSSSMTREGEGESRKDIAKMYELYGDALGIRILDHATDFLYGRGNSVLRELAKHSEKPVINMADDVFHPTQALADLMTVKERLGSLEHRKFAITWAYANVPRGYCSIDEDALLATRLGMDVSIAHPPGFELPDEIVSMAEKNAKASGAEFEITNSREDALKGASVVFPRSWITRRISKEGYAKTWNEEKNRYESYRDWRLKEGDVKLMNDGAIITHVLPVLRGYEADDGVMDSERSAIYQQAENGLFAKCAVLLQLMGAEE
jgi:ornithine carbamoyltransferase